MFAQRLRGQSGRKKKGGGANVSLYAVFVMQVVHINEFKNNL